MTGADSGQETGGSSDGGGSSRRVAPDGSLVSVIVPVFDCERYLSEAIESVIAQTHTNWELILIDDCSSDSSWSIANRFAASDERIKLLRQPRNTGAAAARNRGLEAARGQYIAYLDADDVWLEHKLEMQLDFMKSDGVGMCFTSYETVNESGAHRNYIHVPATTDYWRFLKRPITCTHTVVFDTAVVPKRLLRMPALTRRQDGATWLAVLKTGVVGYGLDTCLAKNRKRSSSLSSNKAAAVSQTWSLYRHIEGLTYPRALYCLAWQVFHAIMKRRGSLA